MKLVCADRKKDNYPAIDYIVKTIATCWLWPERKQPTHALLFHVWPQSCVPPRQTSFTTPTAALKYAKSILIVNRAPLRICPKWFLLHYIDFRATARLVTLLNTSLTKDYWLNRQMSAEKAWMKRTAAHMWYEYYWVHLRVSFQTSWHVITLRQQLCRIVRNTLDI